jgi:hypothetical protein
VTGASKGIGAASVGGGKRGSSKEDGDRLVTEITEAMSSGWLPSRTKAFGKVDMLVNSTGVYRVSAA